MGDELKTRYAIIFLGPAQNTIEDVNKVAYGLQNRFNLSTEAVTKVMRLAPVAIKKDLTAVDAQRYKEVLESIGARVRLEVTSHEQDEPEEYQPDHPSLDKEAQSIPLQQRASSPAPDAPPLKAAEQKQTMTQCPQCGFVQAATDECIKCGVIISKFMKYQEEIKTIGNQTPLQPLDSIPLLEEEAGIPPWEDMANLGFFTAFFRTMKEVLFSPTQFFRKMPMNKGILSPLAYGMILNIFGGLTILLWQYVFSGLVESKETVTLFQTSFTLIYALLLPIIVFIGLFLYSGYLHLCLLIVGGAKRGVKTTFRVVAYSTSPIILCIVPILGWIVGNLYYIVLWVIGVREGHRITTGRALFAVIFLPLIFMMLLALLGIIAAIIIPSIISQGQMTPPQPPSF